MLRSRVSAHTKQSGMQHPAVRLTRARQAIAHAVALDCSYILHSHACQAISRLPNALHLCHATCRDCPGLGSYDKVVSIEMIEAVGHEHLVSYFATINAALKPGGKAVIQVWCAVQCWCLQLEGAVQ